MIKRLSSYEEAEDVISLLKRYDFDEVTPYELMSGVGFVAYEDEQIVGFIWALVSGSVAMIDYLVVDEEYRYKYEMGRSKIGINLAVEIYKELVARKVTKFCAIISGNLSSMGMLAFYRDGLGMNERRVLTVVNGRPELIYKNLCKIKEASNG